MELKSEQKKETVSVKQIYPGPTGGYPVSNTPRLETTARIILMGVYDDDNILSTLRGMLYIVKYIWELTMQFNQHYWSPYMETKFPSYVSFAHQKLKFPKPTGININMMPFILAKNWKETKLPNYLKPYETIIVQCYWNGYHDKNKICYLTIQESFVEKGKTQRRPGLHVETPGYSDSTYGGGKTEEHKWQCNAWGDGVFFSHTERRDGIFMASNVDNSCALWNCKIVARTDKKNVEAIGHLGNIEHLRINLKGNHMMKENKIYWITDRTPHESVPMVESGNRQFFRLVLHKLSLWYDEHSTVNPNGVVPDPLVTRIVKGNKFESK